MTYGTSLGLELPEVSVTTGPQYATLVNTALQALIDRLETKVTPSGIDINTDLSFRSGSSYFGVTDLQRAEFRSLSAALAAGTYPGTLYRVGSDLFYNDADGNQIQITASGAVNISTTGNITGAGYGENGVQVNWDSVNSRYSFLRGSGLYADVFLRDLLFDDESGNTVRLQAPSIGADYTLTLPTALPTAGTAAIVTLDSTGALSHSKTPSVDGLTSNGDVSVDGDLTVTTGDLKHPPRTRSLTPYAGQLSTSWTFTASSSGAYLRHTGSGLGEVVFPIILETGERLLDITLFVSGASGLTMTATIYGTDIGGSVVQLGTDSTAGTAGDQELFLGTIFGVPSSGRNFFVVVDTNGPSTSFRIYGIEYRYDRP